MMDEISGTIGTQQVCALVLGMHRSGTSALTRAINLSGADIASNLMPAKPDNAKGFWESVDLQLLHDQFLRAQGGDWKSILTGLSVEISDPALVSLKADIKRLITQEFSASRFFVIKDPRASLFVSVWEKVLAELGVVIKPIIAFRNPLEVAESLRVRNDMPVEHALLLWLRYTLSAERGCRGRSRAFVDYHEFLQTPLTEVRRLGGSLSLPFEIDAETEEQLQEFIDPRQRHNRVAPEDLSGDAKLYYWVKEVFEQLKRLEHEPDDLGALEVLDGVFWNVEAAKATWGALWGRELGALDAQQKAAEEDQKIITEQKAHSAGLEAELRKAHSEAELRAKEYEERVTLQRETLESVQREKKALEDGFQAWKAESSRILEQVQREMEAAQAETEAAQAETEAAQAVMEAARAETEAAQAETEAAKIETEAAERSLGRKAQELEAMNQELTQKIQELGAVNQQLQVKTREQQDGAAEAKRLDQELKKQRHAQQIHVAALHRIEHSGAWTVTAPLRLLAQLRGVGRARLREVAASYRAIAQTRLFDSGFYKQSYPDIRFTGVSPLLHYVTSGGAEGRLPNPLFDGRWYLTVYEDVKQAGINPLYHYIVHGIEDGRDPDPYFSNSWYIEQYPDTRALGITPLEHYLRFGWQEGRNPSPNFDTNDYLARHPELRVIGINPLTYFVAQNTGGAPKLRTLDESRSESPGFAHRTVPVDGEMTSLSRAMVEGRVFNMRDGRSVVEIWLDREKYAEIKPTVADGSEPSGSPDGLLSYRFPESLRLGVLGSLYLNVTDKSTRRSLRGFPVYCSLGPGGTRLKTTKTVIPRPLADPATPVPGWEEPPEIGLVVLNLNGLSFLNNLFDSFLAKNSYGNYCFYIVDHGSTDGSVEFCHKMKSKIRLEVFDRGGNYSFSESNNFAVERINADFVVLLNNDIVFLEDVLPRMLTHFENDKVGVVGLQLRYLHGDDTELGAIHHLGIGFSAVSNDRPVTPFEIVRNDYSKSAVGQVCRVGAVTAALAMVRREDYRDIGGLHEEYFYGYEDVDFCLTMQSRLGKTVLCDNRLVGGHHCSVTRNKHTDEEKKRVARNRQVLSRRTSRALWKTLRDEVLSGERVYHGFPLRIGFAVSEISDHTPAGDYFTALELAQAISGFSGVECFFVDRDHWYADEAYDVVIAMVEGFDVAKARSVNNDGMVIAWCRNWFERWMSNPKLMLFDQVWVSSELAKRVFEDELGLPIEVIRIAGQGEAFSSGSFDEKLASDYCFTGSYFKVERDIVDALDPEAVNGLFAVFGHGWEEVPKFAPYWRGSQPYPEMPDVYASTRIVIDDANHTCKEWGAANSRVFDALLAGTLVITNSKTVSDDVFNGRLPWYSCAQDLHEKLNHFLSNEADRERLASELRAVVLARHQYVHRGEAAFALIKSGLGSRRIVLRTPGRRAISPQSFGRLRGELEQRGYRLNSEASGSLAKKRRLGAEVNLWLVTDDEIVKDSGRETGGIVLGLVDGATAETHRDGFDSSMPLGDPASRVESGVEQEARLLEGVDGEVIREIAWFVDRSVKAFDAQDRMIERSQRNAVAEEAPGRFAPGTIEKPKVALVFYPDYTVTNPYQSLLYAFGEGSFVETRPGDIDTALALLAKGTDDSVVFHQHWTSVVLGDTADPGDAQRRVDGYLAKVDEFLGKGGRLLWTIHNAVSHEAKFPHLECTLANELGRRAQLIHVHSESVPGLVEAQYRVPPEKVAVGRHGSYLGVYADSIPRSEARALLGIPPSARVFLFLGQIRAYKGVMGLIDAFEALVKAEPNAWLVLAGAPVKFELDNLENRLAGIKNVVGVYQRVEDSDLQRYLRASDFMVLPYESILTSGTLFLGQSFSLPVIAPNRGLIPESVGDGEEGYVYDPLDADGLFESMRNGASLAEEDLDSMKRRAGEAALASTWDQARGVVEKAAVCGGLGEYRRIKTQQGEASFAFVRGPAGEGRYPERMVGVVVLHYHHLDDTIRCVRSVLAQDYSDFELYIVSNDEHPNAFPTLCALFPSATVIQAMENGGYAKGNNLALSMVQEKKLPYFWLLNPDAWVAPRTLGAMMRRVEDYPDTGMFGVTIIFGDLGDKVWFCGGEVGWKDGLETKHGYLGKPLSEVPEDPFDCDYITGACILGRTEVLDKVGLLPEEYFLYFEETDWCLTAGEAGYRMTVFPDLVVEHFKRSEDGGVPTNTYLKYFCTSALRLCEKKNKSALPATREVLKKKARRWLEVIDKKRPRQAEEAKRILEDILGPLGV